MSDDQPLVSIVTPSFNQARYLEDTIRSVLCQDYPHLEYFVIDGGSTDGSEEIVRRYSGRLRGWVSEPDAGQADAIEKGLRLASGEIVAWLNADDLYYDSGVIRSAVEALWARPEATLVYANGVMVDAEGFLLDWHRYRQLDLLDLLCMHVLLQPTAFMRRAQFEAVGGLRQDLHLVFDHDLWIRLASRGPILHVDATWAVERTHRNAKTVAMAARFVDESRRMLQGLETDPGLGPMLVQHRRRIRASLEVFSAKRLIDAGRPREALLHFMHAISISPLHVMPVWYKVVQALGGAIGLGDIFLAYRRTRRAVQHGSRRLLVDDQSGVRWLDAGREG